MAASRHLGFDRTGNSAVRSAVPKNPILEPKTKLIGSPIAEIWQFEISNMAAGHHLGFSWIWRSMKWFVYFVWLTHLSWTLYIITSWKKFKNQQMYICKIWFYAFWRPYWIFGRQPAILDLRQNLRWPRSVFQIVWSEVYESTEKTLTGKKGSFYLAWTLQWNFMDGPC